MYRASISRTVGLVVAPCEAASARGEDAPRVRGGKPRNDARLAVFSSGSVISPIERRGALFPMRPLDPHAIGELARAVPRIRLGVTVNASAMPVERNRKGE